MKVIILNWFKKTGWFWEATVMSGVVQSSAMIPPDLLEMLVCPACRKPLVLKVNPEALKCETCQRVYPVRDNIPVLLIDEASTDPS